eukprot:INCI7057.2.p1 GENE.INCI7057.2~~INCI7057.2.p1  ORF type:complete len:734 (+),score=100.65 INCI7057.2:293-2494(+)
MGQCGSLEAKEKEASPPPTRPSVQLPLSTTGSSGCPVVEQSSPVAYRRDFSSTARLRAEEAAELNPANELFLPFVTANNTGTILSANKACCLFLGYPPETRMRGMHVEDIMPPAFAKKHAGYMQHYLDHPEQGTVIGRGGREVQVMKKDGSLHPAMLTIAQLPNKDGFCAALLNLEGVMQAREQKLLTSAAERAVKERTRFISYLSHEIRVPMNALCMGISLLAEGDVADLKPDPAFAATQGMPTLAGQCNDLRNCCETILHLLNDVLDMEKMRSGAYVYSYRPVDLTAVCRRAQSMASMGVSGAPTINFSRHIAPQCNTFRLWCDGHRLLQVLGNFLSNAVRHTPAGGNVALSVIWQWRSDLAEAEAARRAKFKAPPDAKPVNVRFEIWNSGSFIAKKDVTHVFQPFVQLGDHEESSRMSSISSVTGKRTGIGLSICQQIVEQGHLGRIGASSDESGTTFFATLPVFAILPERIVEELEEAPSTASTPAPNRASASDTNLSSANQESNAASASSVNNESKDQEVTAEIESVPIPSLESLDLKIPARCGSSAGKSYFGEPKGKVDVLYVDDSNVNLKMIGRMLRGENISFHCAENGALPRAGVWRWSFLASQLCRWRELACNARCSVGKLGVEWLDEVENSCALVLMDRTMPVMDGVTATKLIKQRHPSLTVVGLTGDAQSEDISDLKEAGAEHIIVKPVFKEQLLRVVKAFIGSSPTARQTAKRLDPLRSLD